MSEAMGQHRKQGFCSECGARRRLQADGTVPEHPVHRVSWDYPSGEFKPRAYASEAPEDARCDGTDRAPSPLPSREPRKRISATRRGRLAA